MKRQYWAYYVLLTASFISWSHAETPKEWDTIEGKIRGEFIEFTDDGIHILEEGGKSRFIDEEELTQHDRNILKESMLEGNNFSDPWPTESNIDTDIPIEVISEAPGHYVFGTPHFKFISDAKITEAVVKRFSQIFEATYEANRVLPFNNAPLSDPDEKFRVFLFENREDYLQAGGLPNSGGCQIWDKTPRKYGYVIVPFESLEIKQTGKSYTINYKDGDSSALTHEITHMLMRAEVTSQPWFSEGASQYLGCTPYRNGRYNFKDNKHAIISYITDNGLSGQNGLELTKNITLAPLKSLMTMSYSAFNHDQNESLKYGAALLITYYFYHGDGQGDAQRIKKFVRALQIGASMKASHQLLLDGRTWEELSDDVIKFWGKNGIKVSFAKEEENNLNDFLKQAADMEGE